MGKTTLLLYLSGNQRTYVSLDDPLVLSLASEDPPLFLQRFSPSMLIDRIHYAPQLLPYLKMAVDRNQAPGENTEALFPRHGLVRLSDGMVESGNARSRGHVRCDPRNMDPG